MINKNYGYCFCLMFVNIIYEKYGASKLSYFCEFLIIK